ncbi:MAG: GAF domain-containing protein [Chloroflexia bacterium]|nr:GAF domain-containing protein [Chloroflexia bacterium]
MESPGSRELLQVVRGLLGLRAGLLFPFLIIAALLSCTPALAACTITTLLLMAVFPLVVYTQRQDLLLQRRFQGGLAIGDLVLITLLNSLLTFYQDAPMFFPLYLLVAIETAFWWGWWGSLFSGALGAGALYLQYLSMAGQDSILWPAAAAITMGWTVVVGYFVQITLTHWLRTADQLAIREKDLQLSQRQLLGWRSIWNALSQEVSSQQLLEHSLRFALEGTASPVGLIAMEDPIEDHCRTVCWRGFALSSPNQTIFRPDDCLPSSGANESLHVHHVLRVPLKTPAPLENGLESAPLGWIVTARTTAEPYQPNDEHWLDMLATYAAVMLENLSLQGQLNRLQHESHSIALAGWTLASLPNPTAAIETACRRILGDLALSRVTIFLYGRGNETSSAGCRMLTYPVDGPACTVLMAMQGRGLNQLRRFLERGTPLIANRRSECPEIFAAMEWDEGIQSAACFPLVAPQRQWGVICLLAAHSGAFSPQTQQSLDILSREIAMTLENVYLRRLVTEKAETAVAPSA